MEEADKLVRLTEDLLFAVNKKLESRDKKTRNEASVDDDLFDELVGYRRTWPSTFSQTKKAIMHKLFFDRNSILKIRYDSTEVLVSIAHINEYLFDYHKNARVYTPCKVGFINLPGDFFDPNEDCIEKCTLFKELAWKEKDMILIETERFTECILIWRLKQWLENCTNLYPLQCYMKNPSCGVVESCQCRNIFRVATFLSENCIQRLGLENIRSQSKIRRFDLLAISRIMFRYCGNLISGEEIISESSRAENVVFAMHLRLLAEKFNQAHNCLAQYEFLKTHGKAIGNPWVDV